VVADLVDRVSIPVEDRVHQARGGEPRDAKCNSLPKLVAPRPDGATHLKDALHLVPLKRGDPQSRKSRSPPPGSAGKGRTHLLAGKTADVGRVSTHAEDRVHYVHGGEARDARCNPLPKLVALWPDGATHLKGALHLVLLNAVNP